MNVPEAEEDELQVVAGAESCKLNPLPGKEPRISGNASLNPEEMAN